MTARWLPLAARRRGRSVPRVQCALCGKEAPRGRCWWVRGHAYEARHFEPDPSETRRPTAERSVVP